MKTAAVDNITTVVLASGEFPVWCYACHLEVLPTQYVKIGSKTYKCPFCGQWYEKA